MAKTTTQIGIQDVLCPVDGTRFTTFAGPGRPRLYCSDRCKQADDRARRKQSPERLQADIRRQAERVSALALMAKANRSERAPWAARRLDTIAAALNDVAEAVEPEQLPGL